MVPLLQPPIPNKSTLEARPSLYGHRKFNPNLIWGRFCFGLPRIADIWPRHRAP
jgi:hypothetical protein